MYILIDSGTTTTRVRVTDGQRVLAAVSEQVGARDTAQDGNNWRLRSALGRLLTAAAHKAGFALQDAEAVVASGMITSGSGLLEVPHVLAPAGPEELRRGAVTADFPDIAPQSILFIPGIKTVGRGLELAQTDLIRGEETEVIGLRQLLALTGPATFLHCGSHHKAIATDAAGCIVHSKTTLTGELLQAISAATVVSASVLPPAEVCLDPSAWRQGLAMVQQEGFGRTLFLTRVVEQTLGYSKEAATNFLLGALTALDLPMVERALAAGDQLVLYGNGHFPHILHQYLTEQGRGDRVTLVPPETAELGAVVGAVAIYRQQAEGGRRP